MSVAAKICGISSEEAVAAATAGGAAYVGELLKEALEAGGRDDLEDPARLVARVPKRVPLIARLEHEVARSGLDDVVAQQRAHTTLEDKAVLVLAGVQV